MMKKLLFILAFGVVSYHVIAQDLVILHTNDMHSHLNGLAPESEYTPLVNDNDPTKGGFARIAGFIQSEKGKYGDKLLVVDAGDFLMGTLFQTLETESGFQLNLMKKMGYDYMAIGNHEFDLGPNAFASIIDNNKKQGQIPQLLNANYVPAKDGSDAQLVKKFNDGTILPYTVVEKNGYKIGLFGLLGLDADEAIAGYINVTFDKINKVAKKTASFLKDVEKVDLVVVLSHSGVTRTKEGTWEGEDYELAKAVPDIDLVIGGHTHTYLPQAVKAGNGIVVQTGDMGSSVGRIAITFDVNKKPVVDYQLVPMDDNIPGDAEIQKLIDQKSEYISKNLLSGLGIDAQQPLFETSFELTMNDKQPEPSNLGPFVSDAVYYMLNKRYNEEVDMTIVATGVIRHNINIGKTGRQNIHDIFNIMPLGVGEEKVPGSPMGKIYITGNELKKVMELIFAVYHSKVDYYLYSTGMQIKYNPEKGLFKKISEITVGSEELGYRKVSFSKKDKTLYSLAANKYILSFIGALKKMSFGVVNVVGKNADGSVIENDNFLVDLDKSKEGIQEAKEWLALVEYVRSFPDTNGNGIPDMPEMYKTKVNAMTVVK
jgi:5'-nucleotidase